MRDERIEDRDQRSEDKNAGMKDMLE